MAPIEDASLLVLRPGALGDTLLAVPALRALRRRFPRHRIILAAHGSAAHLLQACGEVHTGLSFDHPSIRDLLTASSTAPTPPDQVVAWLSDPDGNWKARLQTSGANHVLVAPSRPPDDATVHCAAYLLQTLRPLGIASELDPAPLRISISTGASESIYIHPGSGSPRKNWPASRFATVVRHLTRQHLHSTLVVGEADEPAAAEVERAYGTALPRLQDPPLFELALQLATCRAYLGNDSGVSHLAGLVGAPTVVLFGPTSPDTWRPLGPAVTVLPFATDEATVADILRGAANLQRKC